MARKKKESQEGEPKTKKSRPGGSHYMRSIGKKNVMVWLTPEQHEKLRSAALYDGRTMASMLVFHGFKEIERFLAEAEYLGRVRPST